MKLAIIYGHREISEQDISSIKNILSRYNIEYNVVDEDELLRIDKKTDFLIVIGGDKILLRTLLNFSDTEIPIIPLYGRRSKGFLYVAGVDHFLSVLNEIIRGNYEIDERIRLRSIINDTELPSALNEVAIFSKTTGSLMRYTLFINNEFVWKDDSDGVIISTPTGSTAYALSAGGSIIKDADVFEIVPVNSIIPTHKPIITSCKNRIIIEDLTPNENILIIDGQIRKIIESNRIEFCISKYSAKFIRLKSTSAFDIDKRLVHRLFPTSKTGELKSLPPSAKLIYKILEYEGPLTYREIVEKSELPSRTVRYALKILMDKELIVRGYLDRDARRSIYKIN